MKINLKSVLEKLILILHDNVEKKPLIETISENSGFFESDQLKFGSNLMVLGCNWNIYSFVSQTFSRSSTSSVFGQFYFGIFEIFFGKTFSVPDLWDVCVYTRSFRCCFSNIFSSLRSEGHFVVFEGHGSFDGSVFSRVFSSFQMVLVFWHGEVKKKSTIWPSFHAGLTMFL